MRSVCFQWMVYNQSFLTIVSLIKLLQNLQEWGQKIPSDGWDLVLGRAVISMGLSHQRSSEFRKNVGVFTSTLVEVNFKQMDL